MFSLFKIKEQKAVIRQEAVAALQQARSVAQRTVEHTGALGSLFSAELKEYVAHQVQRIAMLIVSCVLLLGGYLLFCATLAAVINIWLGLPWALGIVCGLNFVVAIMLLLRVKAMSGKRLAPATAEELKKDWQCLKLLCQEKSKP